MGKKANGFMLLVIGFLDALMGYSWYVTLCPTEVMSQSPAVLAAIWGAILTLFTLMALVLNFMVYMLTVAEESYAGFFTIKTRVEKRNPSETQSSERTVEEVKQ